MVANECSLKKSNDSMKFTGMRSLYYQHLAARVEDGHWVSGSIRARSWQYQAVSPSGY